MSSKSARHRAREFALQGIYQWQVGGQDEAAIEAHTMQVNGFDKADAELYRLLLRGTMNDSAALQEVIQQFVDRPWVEMSPIERGVLLLGAFEFKHHVETPYRVVLNEAIELAKEYGGTDGHKFVNGVLDKLAVALRPHEAKAR
ncbi:MAG TPA: transcription antitermination factor NusB [Rhodocyclaceae bacterium]|jgi:N utilization substance protein B|nr:transcription antitermination factor NusB [Rhodocyclaceae bacterium]